MLNPLFFELRYFMVPYLFAIQIMVVSLKRRVDLPPYVICPKFFVDIRIARLSQHCRVVVPSHFIYHLLKPSHCKIHLAHLFVIVLKVFWIQTQCYRFSGVSVVCARVDSGFIPVFFGIQFVYDCQLDRNLVFSLLSRRHCLLKVNDLEQML